MTDDLPLTIPWKSMVDFFNCPVCICPLQNTNVTPCGHRYCEKCIRECIDRHHKCPCCNNPLRQQNLIKDPQYDDLVAVATKQKEASEKRYFDHLIDSAGQQKYPDNLDDPMRRILSPVESVLKEHLKNSLSSHERYYQELKQEFDKRKKTLEEDFNTQKEKIYNQGLSAIEIEQKLAALQTDLGEQRQNLEDDIDRCGRMVAEAFDKYLSEHIPSLSILPVTVTLSILNKSIQMHDINIKPHDSLGDIKLMLRRQMEARGDRIVEFDKNVQFLCFGPLAKRTLYEMHRMAHDVVELGATHHDIRVLPEQCRPILQYQMKPGSEIAVYGRVMCESDMPKQCFAVTFEAGKGSAVDYFSCKDCKFNWVCRSCMESCHKDHNIAPYIMNHQPTWACCYCPKKKKCIIQGQ